ncbi:hypothetical protein F4604DRAFT_1685119 [Suillus subluteus]|nr:hypothetical protein F4604DRAFT_1685119 [Suillus subluteus]
MAAVNKVRAVAKVNDSKGWPWPNGGEGNFGWIELVGDANKSREELAIDAISRSRSSSWSSGANIDINESTSWNGEGPPWPANKHGNDEVDSVVKLKERLQLAERTSSQLAELYQKYRLRWLEESYRARVLEGYAPKGVTAYSPHQITWDAPSPAQSTSGARFLEVN